MNANYRTITMENGRKIGIIEAGQLDGYRPNP